MRADLEREYLDAVARYIASPDEEGRARAYELGREAISRGLGVLDVSTMHARAISGLDAGSAAIAWDFLTEALAPFEMVLRGFRDANAQLKQFARTLEDRVAARTAELRDAEARLREQRNLLRRVIDSIPDGVAVSDAEGRITVSNPVAERILGSGDVVNGPTWRERWQMFLPDEQTPIPPERVPIQRGFAGEEIGDEEIFLRSTRIPGGVHLSVSASPLCDASGATIGGVVVLRDVTARRKAEQLARKAEERLARAQKLDAIGQLAGGVAHDFNNILAVVSSYASLLRESLAGDEQASADLREIEKAADSAASLTRQLLAFSRQQVLQPSQLALNEVVADVVSMLKRAIGEHIDLTTSLGDPLWSVVADRGQIEQVLMNLAVNARDAMPQGGKLLFETRNIEVEADEDGARTSLVPGAHVLLSVTDTGTGMDEATKRRIFEPFFTTKELGRGTGLGLATVYGIVQQSGGHIQVYSEVGKGTCFKIYLPRSGEVPVTRPRAASRAPSRGTETILLVEDDDSVRRVAARVLEGAGYRLLIAADPAQACAASAAYVGPIHVLITDVVMPGIAGIDLARELGRQRPDMLVLFMSGYSAAGVTHQGIPPNAAFLEKPFTAVSLRRKVEELLRPGTPG